MYIYSFIIRMADTLLPVLLLLLSIENRKVTSELLFDKGAERGRERGTLKRETVQLSISEQIFSFAYFYPNFLFSCSSGLVGIGLVRATTSLKYAQFLLIFHKVLTLIRKKKKKMKKMMKRGRKGKRSHLLLYIIILFHFNSFQFIFLFLSSTPPSRSL